MLLRNSFHYLIARGIPGLVNFVALAVYTRLLTTEEFGRYALVLSIIGLVHVLVFQWLLLVLGRFLPRSIEDPAQVLRPVLALFLSLAGVVAACGLLAAAFWPTSGMVKLILLAATLAVAQAWHELNLRLATAFIQPARYGLQLGAKAVFSILIGASLAWLGWGTVAPLIGLTLGSLMGWWLFSGGAWHGNSPKWPPPETLADYRSYGLPLAITFALVWITSSADRIIIAWLIDESAAGFYAVGYDLAQHSLGLLLVIINTAAMPLAIRSLENEGIESAAKQVRHNGEMIFVLSMAGAAGLIAIGPTAIGLFIGNEFRPGALAVFPWIALTAAVIGIKSFHFDIAFHLVRKSGWLVLTSGVAACFGIALNFLLIPYYGIVGAAWASLTGFLLAAVLSAILGRRVFPMPSLVPLLFKGAVAAAPTYLCASWAAQWSVIPSVQLITMLLAGGIAAAASCLSLNVAGSREIVKSRLIG